MNKLPEKFDLVNKEFGALKVIERTSQPSHFKAKDMTYWSCLCKCGNEVVFSRERLSRGEISCGCVKKPRKPYTKRKVKEKKSVDFNLKRLGSIWRSMKETKLQK